jgi:uncharacterized protein
MPQSPPTPSPCIDVCQLNDATGLCEGCFRSIQEIMRWSGLDEPGRRAVVAAADARKQRLTRQGD